SSIPRIGSSAQDHEHDISNAPPFEPVYTVPNFNSLLVAGADAAGTPQRAVVTWRSGGPEWTRTALVEWDI
ncbi:hypothetical protein, partial [Burkholderia sp. RS02]|uniref:hypothetical protein n=1 Tax=unclassified Burkholderia TaxID=2613784 RepID=UPI00321896BA